MNALGLYVTPERIVAVRLGEDGDWTTRSFAPEEASALVELREGIGNRIGAVFDARFTHRRLHFPFASARKIRQAAPLTLDNRLARPYDQYAARFQIVPDSNGAAVDVTLIDAAQLEWPRTFLTGASLDVRFLEPGMLLEARRRNYGEDDCILVRVRALETHAVFLRHGICHAATTVPIGGRHLQDAYALKNLRQRLLAAFGNEDAPWQFVGDVAAEHLKVLAEGVETTEVGFVDTPPAELGEGETMAWLAASAALERRRPRWNFAPRRPVFVSQLFKSATFRTFVPAGGALLVLMMFATGAGNRAIRAEADYYRSEVIGIFKRTFPDSRPVDPLRQMRGAINRADGRPDADDGQIQPVLYTLRDFHDALTGTSDFTVRELKTLRGEWTMDGDAADFAGVDAIKEALAGLERTKEVRVERAEQAVGREGIRFRIAWAEEGA